MVKFSFIFFAVLLTVMQTSVPVPRKAANNPASGNHNVQKNTSDDKNTSKPSIPISTSNNQGERQKPPDNDASKSIVVREPVPVSKDWWDRLYVIFTGALVVVGGLGVKYAIKTLKAIEKQAAVMSEQREVMLGQLRSMNGQITAISEQTSVAKESADTARENVELIINKERARIIISLKPPDIIPFDLATMTPVTGTDIYFEGFALEISQEGPTTAFNVAGGATIHTSPSKIPARMSDLPRMSVPSTMRPNIEPITEYVSAGVLSAADVEEIREEKTFVHFFGFITYEDVFGKRRKTSFRYIFEISEETMGEGEDSQTVDTSGWVPYGPPEDNQAT